MWRRLPNISRARRYVIEIRDSEDLTALSGPLHRPAVILLAVAFGDVLLIDQRVIDPRKDSS